jgi:hypothetical protein
MATNSFHMNKYFIAALTVVAALANELNQLPASWHLPITVAAIVAAALNKSLFTASE